MLKINKICADHVIDFAAEELKKYLQMMMPDCEDICISYAPDARDGFRLGFLEDFGLFGEAEDKALDDVVHIDTDEQGGILAGSNARSVLFAVYRYLRLNGCRFFAPGVDGEFIPRRNITPQHYHKMADHRLRGHTIEGRPSIHDVLNYIDYHAKQELNCFGPYTPFVYIGRYYTHDQLTASRAPEPIDGATAEQWTRLIESECLKRGQILAGGSHDFVPYVLGIDPDERLLYKQGLKQPTEEMKSRMAMLNGKRGLHKSDPFFTNFCMSRQDLREKYVDVVVDFVRKNRHYKKVSCILADMPRNHCECSECKKLRPTDFMVMMLNRVDERLTAMDIDTRIEFATYVDQQFPPQRERLRNPSRFEMSFPPISRSYSSSITEDSAFPETQPYVRNGWNSPRSIEECLSYFRQWQEIFPGDCSAFEYHFYVHQYRDPGLMAMSRRIYEDVRSLRLMGMIGYMEDGSNKSFFPHGFMGYIYAESLVDRDVDYLRLRKDYFSHAYGEDWEQALSYFEKMSELFDHAYMCGDRAIAPDKSIYYDPARVENFRQVKALTEEGLTMAAAHTAMPQRIQTVHWQLMTYHAKWCALIADAMTAKCQGRDEEAIRIWKAAVDDFSQYDPVLERWFDMSMAAVSFNRVMKAVKPAQDF